ncbi:MAG: DUF4114 domain-containing protein [Pseudomonadota bacterium]
MATELQNSTFLDYDSSRSSAALPTGGTNLTGFSFNVAIVLERANDPTPLLNASWASRQQQLGSYSYDQLWQTYGADQADYDGVLNSLPAGIGLANATQYVSSAYSRTIWVTVSGQADFQALFDRPLLTGTTAAGETVVYWEGNLKLPDAWVRDYGVQGLWFDTQMFGSLQADPGAGASWTPPDGPQSQGNSASPTVSLYPNQIAETYYNFPLTGDLWNPASPNAVTTGAIGLLEPGVGTALSSPTSTDAEFEALLAAYRNSIGIDTPGTVVNVAPGGQAPPGIAERSLDVGVVTAVNPQSTMVLYGGSGWANHAHAEAFTAYQQAIWDTVNNPEVVSSSYRFAAALATQNSPFLFAASQLFVDAALANVSIVSSSGDGGSGLWTPNGFPNVSSARASAYGLLAGGTSLSPLSSALSDDTLDAVVDSALAGDPATIWQLVAGGLRTLPASLSTTSPLASQLVEAVWNTYRLHGTVFAGEGYYANDAGNGGVDPTQPTPWYQAAFGLAPVTSDPFALSGRGAPDVSANAGGSMFYTVPQIYMEGVHPDAGTSSAAPLWAALLSQINAIFEDQDLPDLGYANDLLYIAAAIAPASFNDVTIGNNTSSFVLGGTYTSDGIAITPTGYGYQAVPGYDLATGLGSPNGVLLARALTTIAHSQMSYSSSPDMLDGDGAGGWQSGTHQSLTFQTMSAGGVAVDVGLGGAGFAFDSAASSEFAWTNRFAQQVLQDDFDPNLVRLFDKQAQGWVAQSSVGAGQELSVSIDGAVAQAVQGTLSSPFGFADFASGAGAVRVARPVAVAETAGGADDQTAVVRVRQNGEDSLSLTFYRVDDLSGTITGIRPGDAAYALAAEGRAYQIGSGGTAMGGPGYGNYQQTTLLDVDAGDLIAMKLFNNDSGATFWAFAQANESVAGQNVGHLWSYGLNTWGWEDTWGGGDRDFNDFIIQLDFTSAAGHGWLA